MNRQRILLSLLLFICLHSQILVSPVLLLKTMPARILDQFRLTDDKMSRSTLCNNIHKPIKISTNQHFPALSSIIILPIQRRRNTRTRQPRSHRIPHPRNIRLDFRLHRPSPINLDLPRILPIPHKPAPPILQYGHPRRRHAQCHGGGGACHAGGFSEDVAIGPGAGGEEGRKEVVRGAEGADGLVDVGGGVDYGEFGVTEGHD